MSSPKRLQFKIGQCVSSVLEDVDKRTDAEVSAWLAGAIRTAREAEREARKLSKCESS